MGVREDTDLLKLQSLQNNVIRIVGNIPRSTRTCELYVAYNTTYKYNYITTLCKRQAEVKKKSRKCKYSQHRPRRSDTQKL